MRYISSIPDMFSEFQGIDQSIHRRTEGKLVMATILSFRRYHSPLSDHPSSLLLRPVFSRDQRRRFHFSVSAAGNRKAKEEISDDRRAGTLPGEGRSSAMEVGKQVEKGFEWKWPLWKELPMRYKLIGTTSLAFVVCNMDKAFCFLVFL